MQPCWKLWSSLSSCCCSNTSSCGSSHRFRTSNSENEHVTSPVFIRLSATRRLNASFTVFCLLVSLPDQSLLLQRLPEDEVFGQDVTQQEVVFLLLCGNETQSDCDDAIARVPAAAAGKALIRWSADAPAGPVELVLMTLQNSVTGCSRKRRRQYSRYLGGERKGSRSGVSFHLRVDGWKDTGRTAAGRRSV